MATRAAARTTASGTGRGTRSPAGVLAGVLIVVLACVWVVFAAACAPGGTQTPQTDNNGRLGVVATVGMVADMVRGVGGERVEVVALMGTGVDPHLYRPTRSDMARLLESDAVFASGLLLEGKLSGTLDRVRASGKPVFEITDGVDRASLLGGFQPDGAEESQDASHADPHVWMDPSLWSRCVGLVRESLTALDPEGAAVYEANAGAYAARLTELDAYAQRVLGSVPERRRVLITAHDAFGYFGRRYGYEVVGIQGISTESEAGVRDIERIVSLIVDRGVSAVFVESTVSERNIGALVAGANAKGMRVGIGGSLFSDAMGEPGTYEGTYFGMIDHNVTTIARALGGEAPPRGMDGRLAP